MKDKHYYQCSGYVNGRICDNDIRVRRDIVEGRLLASIKKDLLSDQAIREFKRRLRRTLLEGQPNPCDQRRSTLRDEISNITDAIAKGILSPALAERLQAAEAEFASLPVPSSQVSLADVLQALPATVLRYQEMVSDLGNAAIDMPRAQAAIKDLVGEILVEPRDGYLVAKMGLELQPLSGSSIRGSGGRI